MTPAQAKFVELEKKKAEVKKFFEELQTATETLVKEHGTNFYFQDPEGTVYKLIEPEGRFVKFDRYGYIRTRRVDEKRGDLSLKEAEEAGFTVERKN